MGVGLLVLTVWTRLDALITAVVAVYVLRSIWSLLRNAVGGLMDAAVSDAVQTRIRDTIAAHSEGALEAHDQRTRCADRRTFIDYHSIVHGTMDVAAAHDICDHVEAALKREIEGSLITIHVEPDDKAKNGNSIKF